MPMKIEVSENLVTLSLSSDVSDIDGIPRLLSKLNLLNFGMNYGIYFLDSCDREVVSGGREYSECLPFNGALINMLR